MFQMGGSKFSVDHGPNQFSGRWHQCSGPECDAPTTSTRSGRGVGGRTFESLQFGGGIGGHGESSGSRGGRSPQRVVEGEAGCTRTAIEGTVGPHRRIHRIVTAPHPEVRSRARSRDGASEFGFAETGKVARADCCRAKCRSTPSPIRLRGRVGEVEGHSCPVGSQFQHQSSSQRICGSCRSCEDQGRQAQGVGCDDDTIPNDAQDFDEWIGTKMLELRDANDVGDLESVIHLTSLISQGASRMKTKAWQLSVLSNMVVS